MKKKIEFAPAPEDFKESHRNKDKYVDRETPYKLMVFPSFGLAVVMRYKLKSEAVYAFEQAKDTAILTDFTKREPKFLGYKHVKRTSRR